MKAIFISYRRDDSIVHAGRLFDRLTAHFGPDLIFMDTESISIGDNWLHTVDRALASCMLMIVVIGPQWVRILHERVNGSTIDQVRYEIAHGLARKLTIIPVLVSNATMPIEGDLPDDLRHLVERQAFVVSDLRFGYDIDYLTIEIDRLLGKRKENSIKTTYSLNTKAELSVVGIGDILSWGWDGKRLLDVLLGVDYQTLEGLTPDYVGTVDQWAPIVMDNPDTWRVLVDRPESIVGNWHFVPLFEDDYERARAGRLRERDITADRVPYMDMPGWYDIHFIAVFLLPRFRQIQNILQLRRSILDHFTILSRQGVFINRICANAYTPAGEALCKSFEFSRGVKHVDHGCIYERTVYPLPSSELFGDYFELAKRYEEAIKQNRR